MKTIKPKILSVRIETKVDETPDLSFIGKNLDAYPPHDSWAILRVGEKAGEFFRDLDNCDSWSKNPSPNEFMWFYPATTQTKISDEDNRSNALADYKRMKQAEDSQFEMLGIIAKAEIQMTSDSAIQTIRSGGLWGVESDSGADYIKEVQDDQLKELASELLSLGFTKRAIDHAIKSVKR